MIKNATVSARVEEDIKNEAEDILQKLGVPVSVVINSLYRQIIARSSHSKAKVAPTMRFLMKSRGAFLDANFQNDHDG